MPKATTTIAKTTASKTPAKPKKPAAAKQLSEAVVRHELTDAFTTEGGATWPKGMVIDASPAEVARRKIPARLYAH